MSAHYLGVEDDIENTSSVYCQILQAQVDYARILKADDLGSAVLLGVAEKNS
jgi:hypothetical protein